MSSSISAQGSTSRRVKEQPGHYRANPAVTSTQQPGGIRAALSATQASKSQLLAPGCIFSLSVSRSHRRRHLFLTCLCAVPRLCKQGPSALQSSVRTPPHCPWRVGGGQGGPSTLGCWLEMPKPPGDSTQPPCPHQVRELLVDQHSHTRTTGSSSLPVTHCKTSPFPAFVFTSQLGFPRGGTTQGNKPPLTPSWKCVHMKLIKNIPDYFFKQNLLPAFFFPPTKRCGFL